MMISLRSLLPNLNQKMTKAVADIKVHIMNVQ